MRALLLRRLTIATLFCLGGSPAAHAQDNGAAIATFLGLSIIGYGVLSGASVARLLEGARPAHVGDSLRVKGTLRGKRVELIGRATSITADSITLEHGDSTRSFAQSELSNVHAYAGMQGSWAEGWGIGFAGGLGIGALRGNRLGGSPPNCEVLCPNRDQTTWFLGLFGAITGSVVGASVGSLITEPHWRAVNRFEDAPTTTHVSVAPIVGRQSGIKVKWSF